MMKTGKKVAIVSVSDVRNMTMISIYTDYFEKEGISYELICTDRYKDGKSTWRNAIIHTIKIPGLNSGKIKNFMGFLRFRGFAIETLKKEKYDYVVVWNEHTAVILSDFLIKYSPYCVNIRDIVLTNLPFYFRRLSAVVKKSDFSTWCAPKGKELLPNYDYTIVMNQNKSLVDGARVEKGFIKKDKVIHIGVVGYIRHIDESKELMKAFINDDRFVIQFFGTGAELLQEYAEQIGMKNIEISGTFPAERTKEYLDKIDVINVYIGDGKERIDQSLGAPIRYGYSSLLYKPAIVSPNTYLSERTRELNIAYTVKDFKNLPDQFYEWYSGLDFETFKKGCDEFNHEYDVHMEQFVCICNQKIKTLICGELVNE